MSDERTIKPNAPADFTPQLGNYKTLQPFRYWCQKVLPLVYDDSLSYYELLCKVVDYLNKTMEDVETLHDDVTNIREAYEQLQNYVNVYFSSLDVQQEINNKLNQMASDGSLSSLLTPLISSNSNPIMVNAVEKMTDNSKIYVLTTNGHLYYYNETAFYDSGLIYGKIADGTYVDAGNNFLLSSTYETVLPDANFPKFNSYYTYFSSSDVESGNVTKNLPNIGALSGLLFSTKTLSDYSGCMQFFYDYKNGNIFVRQNTGSGNWNGWKNIANANIIGTYVDAGNNFLLSSTYETVLPDANFPKFNSYYTYFSSSDVESGNVTKNLPNIGALSGLLFSTKTLSDYSGCMQFFYDYKNGNIFVRQNTGNGNWNAWKNLNNNRVIHVGNGKQYTSFSRALIEAYEGGGNCTIIVHSNNYDIANEFKELYGADYWDTFTRNSPYYNGLPIGNGIKIIGEKGANIVFNNPAPNNTLIDTDFSVIISKTTNDNVENIIDGLTFTANKLHYILHIELEGKPVDYTITIKNCVFNIDNSNIDSSWNRAVAIGCGASLYSNYVISNNTINCVFPENTATKAGIVFHDASGRGDCYCDVSDNVSNGTIRAQSFGEEIGKCLINIHGNKFGYAMDLIPGKNVTINEWNNVLN